MDMKGRVREMIPLGVEMSTPMIAATIYGKDPTNTELKVIHHVMSHEEKWGLARSRLTKVNGRSVKIWIRLQ